MLYIVATPIGNLEDITLRALKTLKEADFIVAEDTRHSGILLKKYEISVPMISFHSHSNISQLEKVISLLKQGKNIALITDAGTPGISDPGSLLIKEAIKNNIAVTSIPGPSALINAAVLSGLPFHRFLYLGYLPLKKGRKRLIGELANSDYTIIFYEAPHRIVRTLNEFLTICGDRKVAVCREMTKVFEEIFRGSLSGAISHFQSKKPRGEFTVVIENKTAIIDEE